jgi:UDP-glucose 4-epimerase
VTTLLVGGGSFIGAHVIRDLVRNGTPVVAYDVDVRDNAVHRILEPSELGRVTFVQGDVLDLVGLLHAARAHGVPRRSSPPARPSPRSACG